MLYDIEPYNGWDYHALSCKKLDKNKIELDKETLICKVREPYSKAYTEYWILERAQYS